MLFEMPWSAYNTYNSYTTNGQSAFLQAVRKSISTTYPNTSMKGDGQIVQITFSDGMTFEVLPSFKHDDGSYTFPNSNSGGFWKNTNPVPEIDILAIGDASANFNLKPLCRMARAWKRYNNVPISGHLIDTLAYRFINIWSEKDKSYLYYDWLSRDFFAYLKNQDAAQTIWYAVGSGQAIYNPENFRYKATVAHNKTLEAINLETNGSPWSSRQKWREVYGFRFPE